MKFLKYSILSCLTLSLLALIPFSEGMAQDYEKIAQGALLKQARLELAKGESEKAEKTLAKLSESSELKNWVDLYSVENALIKGDGESAGELFNGISVSSLPPFAKLYHRKLEAELLLIHSSKKWDQKASNIVTTLASKKSSLLKADMAYLSTLQNCNRSRNISCLRSLQDLRLRYPASLAALKSYKLQSEIIERDFVNRKDVLTKAFWTTEARVLNSQKKFKDADVIWNLHIRPARTENYNKSLFNLRLAILKGLGDAKQLDAFLQESSTPTSPVKEEALTELITKLWTKNEYAEVDKYIKLVRNSAYATYIRARIDEEQQKFDAAILQYKKLLELQNHPYKFQAALRLGLLYFRTGKSNEAITALQKAQKFNPRTDYYDTVALEYWIHVAKSSNPKVGEAALKNLSFNNDPRLYYYWLKKGGNINSPTEAISDSTVPSLPSNPNCNHTQVIMDLKEKEELANFAAYGVSDLLREEIRFTLRDEAQVMNQVRARANFMSQLGAPAEGIKELRASEKIYASLEKYCLGTLMDILYPKNFSEIYERESKRTGVDKYLLMAITRTESAFDPLAVSHSGAVGLMQLMPFTAELEGFTGYKEGRPEDVFNPEVNIELGANHLKRLFDKYGKNNWHLVIAAYNAGGQAVDRWLQRYPKTPPGILVELITYKETRNYVKKVLGAYWAYRYNSLAN